MTRTVLATAWTIARQGAADFGGSPKLYIAEAMRLAWAEVRQVPAIDQKILARFLDRAADRADRIDRVPATRKQCWFLAKLMIDAGEDGRDYVVNSSAMLTKREASAMIDWYLNGAKAAA